MRYRRVLYSCTFAVLLVARLGPSPAWAALSASAALQQAPGARPTQFEAHATVTPDVLPGPSVLRGAGDSGVTTRIPTNTPSPTATPTTAEGSSPELPGTLATAVDSGVSSRPNTPTPLLSVSARSSSLLVHNQVVVLYGLPGNPDLGVLGAFSPEGAAIAVRQAAATYDALNGSDGVTPMLDLVYAQAQDAPTANGLYLRYLSDDIVARYLQLADRYNLQVMLDLQIGRGDPLSEVRKIERYLRNPRVHVAIDPEYAVGPNGVPIQTPGVITGGQINLIQDYLSELITKYQLPPKIIVVHQYMEGTVTDADKIRISQHVDLVFNMDAFGTPDEKARQYAMFAHEPYATHHGFNVFLQHDDRVMSPEEVLRLSPRPDMIFNQ